jgi:hypothetical protein
MALVLIIFCSTGKVVNGRLAIWVLISAMLSTSTHPPFARITIYSSSYAKQAFYYIALVELALLTSIYFHEEVFLPIFWALVYKTNFLPIFFSGILISSQKYMLIQSASEHKHDTTSMTIDINHAATYDNKDTFSYLLVYLQRYLV